MENRRVFFRIHPRPRKRGIPTLRHNPSNNQGFPSLAVAAPQRMESEVTTLAIGASPDSRFGEMRSILPLCL